VAVPDLIPEVGGRWSADCKFCKRPSILVSAVSMAGAWTALVNLGWCVYESVPGALPRPLCKSCGTRNEELIAGMKVARSTRKKK
jgi:hypothetical protein